jgi:hypothetical protein
MGVSNRMAVRQKPNDRRGYKTGRIPLGPTHFVVLLAGLTLVLTFVAIAVYPTAYSDYVQDVGIKRFERQYGFQSGLVVWGERGRNQQSVWGIISVTPDGAFARAGVRAGDIPVSQHYRDVALYYALEEASSGRPSSIEMINAADSFGTGASRTIELLAPGPLR